ncbi:hypothetical protein FRC12_013663 [Ceratobasidium sp. 428]|nr:hypothetical protein FRC12_013663 [Ceratobasidium sp. 428]
MVTPSLRCLVDNGTVSATSDPNKAALSLAAISIGGLPYLFKPGPYIVLTAWNEDARAACLAVFSSSFLENSPQAVDICAFALENLRSANSGLLKQSYCSLLAAGKGRNLINGLLRRNVLPSYLEMLECEDERIVPYIMTGIVMIIRSATDSESNLSLSKQTAVLSPLLVFGPFLDAIQRINQRHSRLTVDTLMLACATAWLPRLEDIVSRIPGHVNESFVLLCLSLNPQDQGYSIWDEQNWAFQTRCSQILDTDGPPDWS